MSSLKYTLLKCIPLLCFDVRCTGPYIKDQSFDTPAVCILTRVEVVCYVRHMLGWEYTEILKCYNTAFQRAHM